MENILISIRKMLGVGEDVTNFDPDLMFSINTAFMILNQLGIGPENGFSITDDTETWANFLGERKDIEAVKTFIYLKVRLLFDPPTSAFLLEAMERQLKEIEWRLNVQVEKPIVEEVIIDG